MFLPPILRRLFSASPIVAPLLLALTVITLFVGFSGVHQHVVPTAWVGGPGVGGAVQAGAVAANNNGAGIPTPAPPDDDDDNRLPPAYAAYFSDLQLPTELASVPVLGARLRAFLRRPVQTYAEAREGNDAHCPAALADRLVNPDQLRNEGAWWEALAAGEVVRRRAQLVGALADVVRGGGSVVGEEGTRGIVMTAGNKVGRRTEQARKQEASKEQTSWWRVTDTCSPGHHRPPPGDPARAPETRRRPPRRGVPLPGRTGQRRPATGD